MLDADQEVLVLRCADPQKVRDFFETLLGGQQFQLEKHGNGPEHFALQVGHRVFEIYPPKRSNSVQTESDLEITGKFIT